MGEADRPFTDAFNAAAELFQQDEIEQCIEALRNLLADDGLPRYHKIKCLTLLGGIVGNWQESYNCYVKAKTIWRITKRWHCDSEDPKVIKALDDLHEGLEERRYVQSMLYV
jgi:hypothetical protein